MLGSSVQIKPNAESIFGLFNVFLSVLNNGTESPVLLSLFCLCWHNSLQQCVINVERLSKCTGKAKFIPHKNVLNSQHITQSFHFDFHPVRGKSYDVFSTVDFSLFWMNSKLFFFQGEISSTCNSCRCWLPLTMTGHFILRTPAHSLQWMKASFSVAIHLFQALHGKNATKRLLKTQEQI